jgi:glycosyltransferase involved in cell wall biosynthesis
MLQRKIKMLQRKIKIAHIITALTTGGAEHMLLRLLQRGDRERFSAQVISLKDVNVMGAKMRAAGVTVRGLGMDPRRPSPLAVARLVAWLRADRPDVIQTWMTHADLIGGLAARAAGHIPVAWGLHVGHLDARTHGRVAVWTRRLNARLSRILPSKIVCCSETSREVHAALGYDADRMLVIPNGFDLDVFRPDARARPSLRAELGLDEGALVIGHVGRFHEDKGQENLIAAAHLVRARHPEAHFVLCGRDVTWQNQQLAKWIGPDTSHFHILGERDDIPRLDAAFDIACLPSLREAFPLAVGEAMASEVPCVVTDCGDAARMVGGLCPVVPTRDPRAFADAICELIARGPEERARIGAEARRRVAAEFAISGFVSGYERLHEALAHERTH